MKIQWSPEAKKIAAIIAATATAVLAVLASVGLTSCASTCEERISASPSAITFERVSGRRAATGGFVLSKDSLVMHGTE